MNLHTPERQAHESQADCRARQRASRKAASLTPSGSYAPSKLTPKHRALLQRIAARRANTGQRPKFAAVRRHKPKDPIKPTWPHTVDQSRQGRPVHNLNPNRERDPGKREAPKSAVAKRMDRPERVAAMERGHAKLMRFFGA